MNKTPQSWIIKTNMPTPSEKEIYRLMDSFLVESKDQNGNERSIERLNLDRHLFVEKMMELIRSAVEAREREIVDKVKNVHFQMGVSEYLPMVEKWEGKNFDIPFDHGYAKAKSDIINLITPKP